jgi:hypothetical protein
MERLVQIERREVHIRRCGLKLLLPGSVIAGTYPQEKNNEEEAYKEDTA